MNEGRLEQVRKDLNTLKEGDYYDTHDFAIALGESVNLADELAEEVERLRGLESRMEADLSRNHEMLVTLREDHRKLFAVGRDMAANQISEHIGRLTVENKVLEKMLRG